MDEEIKKKWVAALRSGEYKQGAAYLHREGRFCCLGVLCDLAHKEGVVKTVQRQIFDGQEVVSYDGKRATLPSSVVEWAGLMSGAVLLDTIGDTSLPSLNDAGVPFNEIANIIEEFL